MEVHVFEFVPAVKANNEVNNHKSRKNRKKAAKRSTSLQARENDGQSTVPASIETVTMLVSDYQKLTGRLRRAEEIIKQGSRRYNNLQKAFDELTIIVEKKNDEIEKFNTENITIFNNLNKTIDIQNKEIAKLKAIIKDLKGTVITICDSVK